MYMVKIYFAPVFNPHAMKVYGSRGGKASRFNSYVPEKLWVGGPKNCSRHSGGEAKIPRTCRESNLDFSESVVP
jgi:hypothetical protein